ncbi:MAG: hypothetical protein WC780_00860 [Lentimicrobiaceae bacterium]
MFRKIKYMVFVSIILALSCNGLSQNSNKSFYFWKLHSVTGEARLYGHYREQERIGPDINEKQKSSYLSGGILLKTNSSILHRNFLVLDIEGAYMPETRRDNFLVIPDQAEVRTLKKLGFGASFFQHKDLTLTLFAGYDESYSSRENLTDIKSINKHWGGTMGYSNKLLPVTLDFHSRKWKEEELQTGRKYTMDQNLFGARMNKSFTKRDKNELRYSHDENANVNQQMFRIANIIDIIDFNSHVNLDTKQKYSINTIISNLNQRGYTNLKRFLAGEAVYLQLPVNLSFFGNYNFYTIHQEAGDLSQHNVITRLQHMLFKSLQSGINFEYNKIKHTVYQEFNTKTGVEFNYTKKIPGGQLLLSYKFDTYHKDYKADPSERNINSEQYTLTDSKINLLRLPEIDIETVVVKDYTGTLIYENGLDYILISQGKYIEIRRIPGGLISDNSVVLIDYTATQPGSYKYDANTHTLNTHIYLLNNKLSFYYRFSTQDYSNLEQTEFVTLNYYTQNLAGFRLDFGFINAGAEYEDYKSSILPYHMLRYYINSQRNFGNKLMLMLNGNWQDYAMLDKPEAEYQRYMDVTGKAIYTISKHTSLNIDLMYRKQTGRGIDLDLLTAKTEVISSINRLFLTLGVEVYKRNYVGEIINFKGTYVKLVRKF